MKITRNWLADYVTVDWDTTELVERLTMAGLEEESVDDLSAGLGDIVVGHVLERAGHPNADRLSVCSVDVGDGAPRTIVCGAPNVAAGQKVPVVLPGGHLPDGTAIGQAKLRGVESSGMICSEVELGLGTDGSGIMVLADDLAAGASFAQAMGLDDVAIDFEVTPNRPDCLSVAGIAREVAALADTALKLPNADLAASGGPADASCQVRIEDPVGCPRYVARVIRGVTVGPSPAWLQSRLRAVGQRPINNVVDVTNYVMLELGQPLHAFDLHRLGEQTIVVRRARKGESLTTLDGVQHELTEEHLVIADAAVPVALAGVMGGADSEVTESTTDILLESAYFDRRVVRRGAGLAGMRTEASHRFERGADVEMAPVASARAAALLAEVSGGTVEEGSVDVYPTLHVNTSLPLRPDRARRLLAADLDAGDCRRILQRLGCQVDDGPDGDLVVTVPSFRPDLEREVDLIEEVGRIHGYHHVAGSDQLRGPVPTQGAGGYELARLLRERLVEVGLDEAFTSSIVDDRWNQWLGIEACRIANPPAEGVGQLRTSLVPGLLDVARRNLNQRQSGLALFEVGRTFLPRPNALPDEPLTVAGLMTGEATASPWRRDRREVDLYDLKGCLEAILGADAVYEPAADLATLRAGQGAHVLLEGKRIGYFGQAHRDLCAAFDVDRDVYIFELQGDAVARRWTGQPSYTPLPKFPPIERDLAVVLDAGIPAGRVIDEIRRIDPDLVEHVGVFDVYSGDQVEAGKRSLALSLRLRSPSGTLEDQDADRFIDKCLQRLGEAFGARLR